MKKARVIQGHHILYNSPDHPGQEWKVPIYRGEHQISTLMQLYTRKSVSKGFLKWLAFFIIRNEDRAIDLENTKEQNNDKEAV